MLNKELLGRMKRLQRRIMDVVKEDIQRVGVTEAHREYGEVEADESLWRPRVGYI